MAKRIEINDKLRERLIRNNYVHSVTKYNIYFTSEFREKAYLELMSGKDILKIFAECNLPISEPLLSRSDSIKSGIIECGKKGNFKRRYDYPKDLKNYVNSSHDSFVNYILQENAFLKKISNATKGVQN